jgi:hypothetical protein
MRTIPRRASASELGHRDDASDEVARAAEATHSSDPRGLLSEQVVREAIMREVQTRGLAPVARELKLPRSSLASFLAGASRAGTEAIIVIRFNERRAQDGVV